MVWYGEDNNDFKSILFVLVEKFIITSRRERLLETVRETLNINS